MRKRIANARFSRQADLERRAEKVDQCPDSEGRESPWQSIANFGIKGTLEMSDFSVGFGFEIFCEDAAQ